ncbi:MAG: YicC/YloC family endoribonuclease [Pseudomonadota bacterium]
MIQSMTAFARSQQQGNWGSIVCELRSINHRYLEIFLRLPDSLHELEASMRERIRHHIKRGKIECLLRYQAADESVVELVINNKLVEKLAQANATITASLKNAGQVNPMDILRWPGVLQTDAIDLEVVQAEVVHLLEISLEKLVEARAREGEQLKELFLQRLSNMNMELVHVRERLPTILKTQRARLMARFSEASLKVDNDRLEQELVLIAQKIDVTEEIERLETHIKEVQRVLKHGGIVGRRLDFLMQELNREANTLGAKSIDADTTRASVELKVLIEQMREQVQNVE